jgi:hypothetical protein
MGVFTLTPIALIPNHPGDMPEGTLRAILRQADVTTDQFLGA